MILLIALSFIIYLFCHDNYGVYSFTLGNYIIYYETIIVTITISYIVCKFYSFKKIRSILLKLDDDMKYISSYRHYNFIRMSLILLAEINIIISYLFTGGFSSIYLIAILVIVLLFCFPLNDKQILSKKS